MRKLWPFAVAISFDDDTMIISGAYHRRDNETDDDLLTVGVMAAMDFAARYDAEFAIIDPSDDSDITDKVVDCGE